MISTRETMGLEKKATVKIKWKKCKKKKTMYQYVLLNDSKYE